MVHTFSLYFWHKKSQLELWFSQLHLSSLDCILYATFFGSGFLIGLLCKRWSKYIIGITLALIIMFAVLQALSIITINFSEIGRLMGARNVKNFKTMMNVLVHLVQHHISHISLSGIGFIIGFKTG